MKQKTKKEFNVQYQTLKTILSHVWLPMAPDSPIGGHEAMKQWDHPRGVEGHRMLSGIMHGPC